LSRGLGSRQLLYLRAMRALEHEHDGPVPYYVWAVVEKAKKLDKDLPSRDLARHVSWYAGDTNSSRIFALLAERGLVTRRMMTKGRDGTTMRKPVVGLTAAGRELIDGLNA